MRQHLRGLGLGDGPTHLLVALSGGCDSVVLLHLLRFRLPASDIRVSAAHLDHAMRPDSGADAQWVRGLCEAWGVPLWLERLPAAPRGETEARRARYAFLRRAAAAAGAPLIATAHHADDQAETVLFRAVRGTGLKGLAGIAPSGEDLVRPLLPFWRGELEDYARERGLEWRTDPTNATVDPARNRLRNEVIPLIEAHVAPSARRQLVSLAALAREAEEALERLAARAETEVVRWEGEEPVLARDRLRVYDSAIASRLLRNVLRPFGVVLGRTGTRRALQFITDAPSGRRIPLPGGLRVETEFDEARIRIAAVAEEDRTLLIERSEESGEEVVRIGGQGYRVRYGPGTVVGGAGGWSLELARAETAFPLHVRGWRNGDRMRTRRGGRSLKQIFLEHRVPRGRRRRLPVVVDGRGEVLWVAGVLRGQTGAPAEGEESFILTVLHD
ncbi:MAG TPA: tRNA lysidine(34) synthetase TilS [Longimicrobiaceae bacterium]